MIEAVWRASACFVFSSFSFGEVIAITFILQFCIRAATHGIFLRKRENWSLLRGTLSPGVHSTDSGTMTYRAFTYAWRSVLMSFDFQSPDRVIQGWFYYPPDFSIGGRLTISNSKYESKGLFTLCRRESEWPLTLPSSLHSYVKGPFTQ
jgi:hypothetical protein